MHSQPINWMKKRRKFQNVDRLRPSTQVCKKSMFNLNESKHQDAECDANNKTANYIFTQGIHENGWLCLVSKN